MKAYVVDAGIVPYKDALHLQEATVHARAKGLIDRDVLFLLEHPPVFTLGQRTTGTEFKKPLHEIQHQGIEIYPTSRGGNVVYHGPGQLIGYPILDLTQRTQTTTQEYSQKLEHVMQEVGRAYVQDLFCRTDTHPTTGKRYVGLWKQQHETLFKVGFVGVCIKPVLGRFLSMHGFALNTNLKHPEHFELIDPCGLAGVRVASLQDFCKHNINIQEVKTQTANIFGNVFGYKLENVSYEELNKKIKKNIYSSLSENASDNSATK